MDKKLNPVNLQSAQSDNIIILNQERTVCSPEFSEGCMDVETDETDN